MGPRPSSSVCVGGSVQEVKSALTLPHVRGPSRTPLQAPPCAADRLCTDGGSQRPSTQNASHNPRCLSPALLTDCKSQVPTAPPQLPSACEAARRAQEHVAHLSPACCAEVCQDLPHGRDRCVAGGVQACVPSADTSPPVTLRVTRPDAQNRPVGVCGGFMTQAGPVGSLPITWVGCPGNASPASLLSQSNLIRRKEADLLLSLLGSCKGFGTCEPGIVDQDQIHMRKGFWSFDQMRISYKSQCHSFPLTLGTLPDSPRL